MVAYVRAKDLCGWLLRAGCLNKFSHLDLHMTSARIFVKLIL